MTIRTDISRRHLIRLTIVGLACIGFGLWALYDGTIGWPAQRERGLVFQELEEQGRLEEWPIVVAEKGWKPYDSGEPAKVFQKLKAEDRVQEWPQIVAERNWQPYNPGEPKTESEIAVQFVMVAVAGGAGLLVLINVLRSMGRWIEMDDEGLRSSRGQKVKFEQVTQIDKKKWENKGIAKVQYKVDGNSKIFTLDDFIYERPTTDEILRLLEERVGHDKIVNGKPEPPPKSGEASTAPAEPASK